MVKMNVHKLLEEAGKSRYWLVKELGSDYQTVNKMLDGQSTAVYFETLEKLIEIFKCDFNELFTIE